MTTTQLQHKKVEYLIENLLMMNKLADHKLIKPDGSFVVADIEQFANNNYAMLQQLAAYLGFGKTVGDVDKMEVTPDEHAAEC